MNRGSETVLAAVHSLPARFNEAPIHESGKYPKVGSGAAGVPRFNEAPIHESGKCESPSRARIRSGSFNEAPIHESGKYWRENAPESRNTLLQ